MPLSPRDAIRLLAAVLDGTRFMAAGCLSGTGIASPGQIGDAGPVNLAW